MNQPRKLIAPKCNYSFSLGLDTTTLRELKDLQTFLQLCLRDQKLPSQTLVTRAAIRLYAKTFRKAIETDKTDWLKSQGITLEQLALKGRKQNHIDSNPLNKNRI